MTPTDSDLLAMARDAMAKAYAPYSRFRVGAAVLAKSGKVFTGCNVENSSYSLSMCAERVAIHKAMSEGDEITVVAVVCEKQPGCAPCGACRQVIFEANAEARVVTEDGKNAKSMPIGELLPDGFILPR